MIKVGLRQMQRNLSAVLRRVGQGEEVYVTRRNRVVARLISAESSSPVALKWPDFSARAQAVRVKGKPLSDTIQEDREF